MYDETGGDWPDKPVSPSGHIPKPITNLLKVDMISWLLDVAPPHERRSVYALTRRMLAINFAAIHTSSNVSVSRLATAFRFETNVSISDVNQWTDLHSRIVLPCCRATIH